MVDFADVVIEDLPPHPRNTRDRLRPLFLKALQHRLLFPDLEKHQGWFVVYDRRDEFERSIPARYCWDGATTMEQIDEDVRNREKELKKKALNLESELGRFTVMRRTGRIYVKHTGRLPDTTKIKGWVD